MSVEKHYIFHNNKKVFPIYDPPQLVKNVRNIVMKSNCKFEDDDIKWEYIVDLYNTDRVMSIRMDPKSTRQKYPSAPFYHNEIEPSSKTLNHSVSCRNKYIMCLKPSTRKG